MHTLNSTISTQPRQLKKGSHIKPVGTNMAQHQRYIQVCSNIYYTRENTHNQNSSSVILFSCRRNSSRRRSSSRRRYADDDDDTGTNGVVLFSRECVLLTFFFYFTSNNNCSSLLFHVCSFLVAQVNNIWFTVSSSPSAAAFSPCGYNQMVRKPFCCPLNIEVKWPNTIKICRYYHTTKTITYNFFLYNEVHNNLFRMTTLSCVVCWNGTIILYLGKKVNNQIERNQDLDKVSSLNGTFNYLVLFNSYYEMYILLS